MYPDICLNESKTVASYLYHNTYSKMTKIYTIL